MIIGNLGQPRMTVVIQTYSPESSLMMHLGSTWKGDLFIVESWKILMYLLPTDLAFILRSRVGVFGFFLLNNVIGVIGVSGAIHEKDKVKIICGALKDTEGVIVKLDRRNKLAKVSLNIGFNLWLSYDWLDNL